MCTCLLVGIQYSSICVLYYIILLRPATLLLFSRTFLSHRAVSLLFKAEGKGTLRSCSAAHCCLLKTMKLERCWHNDLRHIFSICHFSIIKSICHISYPITSCFTLNKAIKLPLFNQCMINAFKSIIISN